MFPGGELGVKRGFDLAAGVLRVPFIEQVLERDEIGQTLFRVFVFRDGDVPDVSLRKLKLKVVVHHDVLPAESGKIFRHDAVDLPGIHVFHHPLEGGSVEVGAAPAVVNVFIDHVQPIITRVCSQDGPLRLDGNAVAEILIVLAQSHIECGIVRLFHQIPPFLETTHAYDTGVFIIP